MRCLVCLAFTHCPACRCNLNRADRLAKAFDEAFRCNLRPVWACACALGWSLHLTHGSCKTARASCAQAPRMISSRLNGLPANNHGWRLCQGDMETASGKSCGRRTATAAMGKRLVWCLDGAPHNLSDSDIRYTCFFLLLSFPSLRSFIHLCSSGAGLGWEQPDAVCK